MRKFYRNIIAIATLAIAMTGTFSGPVFAAEENVGEENVEEGIAPVDEGAAPVDEGAAPVDESVSSALIPTPDGSMVAGTFSDDMLPLLFHKTSTTYQGSSVEAAQFDNGNVLLLYVTDSSGANGTFKQYDETTGELKDFRMIAGPNDNYIIVLPPSADVAVPEGFEEVVLDWNGQTLSAFTNTSAQAVEGSDTSPSDYLLLYAVSSGGRQGFYLYDQVEGTYQRYLAVSGTSGKSSDEGILALNAVKDGDKDALVRLIIMAALTLIVILLLVMVIIFAARLKEYSEYDYIDEDEYNAMNRADKSRTGRLGLTGRMPRTGYTGRMPVVEDERVSAEGDRAYREDAGKPASLEKAVAGPRVNAKEDSDRTDREVAAASSERQKSQEPVYVSEGEKTQNPDYAADRQQSEEAKVHTYEQISDRQHSQIPEEVPETQESVASEHAQEKEREQVSDRTDRQRERISDRIPERQREQISDRIPERKRYQNSDRNRSQNQDRLRNQDRHYSPQRRSLLETCDIADLDDILNDPNLTSNLPVPSEIRREIDRQARAAAAAKKEVKPHSYEDMQVTVDKYDAGMPADIDTNIIAEDMGSTKSDRHRDDAYRNDRSGDSEYRNDRSRDNEYRNDRSRDDDRYSGGRYPEENFDREQYEEDAFSQKYDRLYNDDEDDDYYYLSRAERKERKALEKQKRREAKEAERDARYLEKERRRAEKHKKYGYDEATPMDWSELGNAMREESTAIDDRRPVGYNEDNLPSYMRNNASSDRSAGRDSYADERDSKDRHVNDRHTDGRYEEDRYSERPSRNTGSMRTSPKVPTEEERANAAADAVIAAARGTSKSEREYHEYRQKSRNQYEDFRREDEMRAAAEDNDQGGGIAVGNSSGNAFAGNNAPAGNNKTSGKYNTTPLFSEDIDEDFEFEFLNIRRPQ